jgi:peptidoglycan/LPS O-acetylase OafA/YrhL
LKGFIRIGATAPLAHTCVMIFFVLSGFVIAFTTFQKRRGAGDYVLARLSRLYSVIAPAIFLTIIVELILRTAYPESWAAISRGHEWARYGITALNLQNVWTLFAAPASNQAFWSLSFEFWYYCLFGVAIFARSKFAKIVSLSILAALIGPQILVLLPVWLMGVALFLFSQRWRVPSTPSLLLFVSSFIALVWISIHPLPNPFPFFKMGEPPLYFAANFTTDYLIGLIFATMLFSCAQWQFTPPQALVKIIRSLSDLTFSLYLFHLPLIILAAAILPNKHANSFREIIALSICLAAALALGLLTERKRAIWRHALDLAVARTTAIFAARNRPTPASSAG